MEKIEIKGINYRLNEETLTAEVIEQENGYEGDIIIPETVVFQEVAYRVTSIGDLAFRFCESLTSIIIPDGVTSIGENAFEDCSSLTSIVIPNGVTSIGQQAFEGCKSISSIVIPDGVKSIGEFAFQYCSSLTSIVIPNRVTSIGGYAFRDCSSLTSITFNGTIAQWKGIELGRDWNARCPGITVHCTDGEVEIRMLL